MSNYSDAMEEIDRLEQLNDRLIQEKANLTEFTKKLKTLLTRAADALEPLNEIYPQAKRSSLIAELRKAAE